MTSQNLLFIVDGKWVTAPEVHRSLYELREEYTQLKKQLHKCKIANVRIAEKQLALAKQEVAKGDG